MGRERKEGQPQAPRSTRRGLLVAGGAALALGAGYPLLCALSEERRAPWRRGPYGPLRPDPRGVLDLPEGFSYRVLDRVGAPMSDGLRVPGRPDGMACFDLGDGTIALLRNHENPARVTWMGPWTERALREAYDPLAMGGVSRLVLDASSLEVRSSNLVLGGTTLNCAGGPSPWGWLSCEETFSDRHGLVFLCDPRADRIAPAQPIPAYGRFRHEAACVEPRTATCFLSEDREDGALYRLVPRSPEEPFEGELQALAVRGRPGLDTTAALHAGEDLEIDWVPTGPADSGEDDLRHRARRAGAAVFSRGEGLAFDPERGAVILTATSGGPHGTGQIFRVEAPAEDRGQLVLLAQSEGRDDFDMPDNVVVAPDGDLYFCEDGHDHNYVRGLGREGRVFDFARNALSRAELTGVCFSPDGRAMFLSIQSDGLTLVVTGPFSARA